MDITSAETKATYDEIKKYVAEHNAGMKVSNLYISQVKRKCGIEVGKNYNVPKNEDSRQPQCPEDKESAIVEALKHFKMNKLIKRGTDAMPGILVVEDDENLNRGITFSLKKSGYEVFSAESVKKAKRIASDNNVDVTICDVNLPDGNGLEFVRWMRCNYNTYIICLTALDQEMDQVMGYEAGADDYITKPFSLSVLLLKIEAHFRRRQEKTEAGKMISGDIVFIAGEMKVLIKSREISLTKTELKMLTFFLQNPKQILSKTQILENVFDLEGDFVDENTIAVNIRRLRKKIEDNPAAPVYIKNIRGLGYIWNQEVRQ